MATKYTSYRYTNSELHKQILKLIGIPKYTQPNRDATNTDS